jgi:hypothetical protein
MLGSGARAGDEKKSPRLDCKGKTFVLLGRFDIDGDGEPTRTEARQLEALILSEKGSILRAHKPVPDYVLLGTVPDKPIGGGTGLLLAQYRKALIEHQRAQAQARALQSAGAKLLGHDDAIRALSGQARGEKKPPEDPAESGDARRRKPQAGPRRVGPGSIGNNTLARIEFEGTTLDRCLLFLEAVYDLNLSVDWNALQREGIEKNTPIHLLLKNASASTALKYLLMQAGAQRTIEPNGALRIHAGNPAQGKRFSVDYDVRGVLRRAGPYYGNADLARSKLVSLIRHATGPGAKAAAMGPREIQARGVTLRVTGPASMQQEVREVLASLGKTGMGSPELQKTRRALQQRLDFQPSGDGTVDLQAALAFIRDVLDVNLVLDRPCLERLNLAAPEKVKVAVALSDVAAGKVLEMILESADPKGRLGYEVQGDGVILVAERRTLERQGQWHCHDVRKITGLYDPEKPDGTKPLIDRIKSNISPEHWQGEGPGRIDAFAGQLVVRTTWKRHQLILEGIIRELFGKQRRRRR